MRRIEQQNVGQCLAYCGLHVAIPLMSSRALDLKLILDLLLDMNVLIDDSQVDELHIFRLPYAEGAEAEVKVYPLEAPDGQRAFTRKSSLRLLQRV